MKLVLAVVNNDDSAIVTSALTNEGFFVTTLSTTGGFLMAGNRTLMIGTDDDKVEKLRHFFPSTAPRECRKHLSSEEGLITEA